MDTSYAAKKIRSPVVNESELAKFDQREDIIIGIVREAEASGSKRSSIVVIETGKDKIIVLLMKNNAGFLVGNLILYDQRRKTVSWVDNASYTFTVITRLKPQLVQSGSLVRLIECPECSNKVKASDISGHFKSAHYFPRTIDLSKIPDQFSKVTRERASNARLEPRATTQVNPTNHSVGPMGGPLYLPWNFEAKIRPSQEELAKHLDRLSADWAKIAGSVLSTVTQPDKFTGKKARRLLVQVIGTVSPPWGGWAHREQDETKRRAFTAFRVAVNGALRPHMVDHIAFRLTNLSADGLQIPENQKKPRRSTALSY